MKTTPATAQQLFKLSILAFFEGRASLWKPGYRPAVRHAA